MKARTFIASKAGRQNLLRCIDAIHNLMHCAYKVNKNIYFYVLYEPSKDNRGFYFSLDHNENAILIISSIGFDIKNESFKNNTYKMIKKYVN